MESFRIDFTSFIKLILLYLINTGDIRKLKKKSKLTGRKDLYTRPAEELCIGFELLP